MITILLTKEEARMIREGIDARLSADGHGDRFALWWEALDSAADKIAAAEAALEAKGDVEYGIPIPAGPDFGRGRAARATTRAMRDMPAGSSRFFPGESSVWEVTRQVTNSKSYLRRYGFKFIMRPSEKNGVRGVRVWRVE